MAIDLSFRIILVMRPVIHFQRMSTHNEGQMSLQENVGCLRSMKFLPQGDSPHPVLDYNTHITFSRNESGIDVFALKRSREIAHGNSEQETMAIVVRFRIIMVMRSISQLHRTQISQRGTDFDTGKCRLPLKVQTTSSKTHRHLSNIELSTAQHE